LPSASEELRRGLGKRRSRHVALGSGMSAQGTGGVRVIGTTS
jgi:hypothetical protein